MRYAIFCREFGGSFIQCLEIEPRAISVLNGMVSLAHSIGLRVVVEGVETEGQLEILCGSGADEVQGFLFGLPQPAEQHLPELETLAVPSAVNEDALYLAAR